MLAAGSIAGSIMYRRRSGRRLERVELYGEDGSVVSLLEGSEELEQVLSTTREILALPG